MLLDILSDIPIFWVKYTVLLTDDGRRRVENEELGLDKGDFSQDGENGGLRIENCDWRALCESHYFEDIVKSEFSASGHLRTFSRSAPWEIEPKVADLKDRLTYLT